jgi:hypothetical protein
MNRISIAGDAALEISLVHGKGLARMPDICTGKVWEITYLKLRAASNKDCNIAVNELSG